MTPTLPRLHHQRGCSCPSCYEWREHDARMASGVTDEKPALRLQGYVDGVPVSDETIRALWSSRKLTLAESLAHMMAEYIIGARKLSPDIPIDQQALQSLFEARLARYISADKIALIISEDAQFQNGQLNTGFLAVKIAEVCEGRRDI